MSGLKITREDKTLLERLQGVSGIYLGLIALLSATGVLGLYSAAGGDWQPWAALHLVRILIFTVMALVIAIIPIKLWFRFAYASHVAVVLLLLGVEVAGVIGMGAQRWLDIGPVRLQPSELAKVTLVLALAKYFHNTTFDDLCRKWIPWMAGVMIALPVLLVAHQPNLGTAIILVSIGGYMLWVAGWPLSRFAVLLGLACSAVPVVWYGLKDYQRQRVLTFFDPERDPLGAGYHIMQSKIAIGSGGLTGKGFLEGTQSTLNFLPEKQTDFIFTLLSEEWGLAGAVTIITLYLLTILYGTMVGLRCRSVFAQMVAFGLSFNLFMYFCINIGMVMGLLPVVGIPLPLLSYGGSSVMTVMISVGLTLSCLIDQNSRLSKSDSYGF